MTINALAKILYEIHQVHGDIDVRIDLGIMSDCRAYELDQPAIGVFPNEAKGSNGESKVAVVLYAVTPHPIIRTSGSLKLT